MIDITNINFDHANHLVLTDKECTYTAPTKESIPVDSAWVKIGTSEGTVFYEGFNCRHKAVHVIWNDQVAGVRVTSGKVANNLVEEFLTAPNTEDYDFKTSLMIFFQHDSYHTTVLAVGDDEGFQLIGLNTVGISPTDVKSLISGLSAAVGNLR